MQIDLHRFDMLKLNGSDFDLKVAEFNERIYKLNEQMD